MHAHRHNLACLKRWYWPLFCLVWLGASFNAPATFAATPRRLPADLYYRDVGGQLARLNRDGTIIAVSHEDWPIADYAVAPDGSHLAYVMNNQLIEVNAMGGERQVKLDGGPLPTQDALDQPTRTMRNVSYTPDGAKITVGWNGVQTIVSGSRGNGQNTPHLLQANDLRHNYIYWPLGWSPDGTRLALGMSHLGRSEIVILNVATQKLVHITPSSLNLAPSILPDLGNVAWSVDSQSFILDNSLTSTRVAAGLVQVDATTGSATLLISGWPSGQPNSTNQHRYFYQTHRGQTGDLFFFSKIGEVSLASLVQMQRFTSDDHQIVPIRTEGYRTTFGIDILWASDDSGAVIVHQGDLDDPVGTPLIWVPSDGGPALALPVAGHLPHWANTTSNAQPGYAPTATAQVLPQLMARAGLNARHGPGKQFAVESQLVAGERVFVLGRTPPSQELWWQISPYPDKHLVYWVTGDRRLVQVSHAEQTPVVLCLPNACQ